MYINNSGTYAFITVFALAQTQIAALFPEAIKVNVAAVNTYSANAYMEIILVKGNGNQFENICLSNYPEGKIIYNEGWPSYQIPLHINKPKAQANANH
ncbi:hypothetical protein [Roseivirga seohaensis]|uniref:hypothetical protein n=1 Tax=Roseivirga seohaensis TaxID=1914963 RepID=UPI003BAD7C0E